MGRDDVLQLPVEQFRIYARNHIGDKYFIPLLTIILAYTLSSWVGWKLSLIWSMALLLSLIPTIIIYQNILAHQGGVDEVQIARWKNTLLFSRTVYLLVLSTMLFWAWVPESNNNHLFLIIFNVGLITATGVMAYSLRGMMIWEVIICSAPPMIRYLMEGGIYYAVAFTSPFFFVLIVILGLEMHKNFISMLKTQKQNLELIDELETLAREDSLTRVHNRRSYLETVKKAISYARRYNTSIGVAVIDVDYFKAINDRYGHSAGDAVLVTIARILSDNIRDSDSLGRLGGEEFSILFNTVDKSGLIELVQRLVDEVAGKHIVTSNGELKTSISAGVTLWDGEESMESLLNRADTAMYSAKHAGRNQLVFEQ